MQWERKTIGEVRAYLDTALVNDVIEGHEGRIQLLIPGGVCCKLPMLWGILIMLEWDIVPTHYMKTTQLTKESSLSSSPLT